MKICNYSISFTYFAFAISILLLAQGTSVERRMGHSWNSPETAKFCKSHTWFTRQQLKLCQLHPDIIPSVTQGAMQAIYECRYMFRNERWNCPVSNVTGVFGKTRLRTSKFIYDFVSQLKKETRWISGRAVVSETEGAGLDTKLMR